MTFLLTSQTQHKPIIECSDISVTERTGLPIANDEESIFH